VTESSLEDVFISVVLAYDKVRDEEGVDLGEEVKGEPQQSLFSYE
jgi:hypothetical protein